MFRLMFRHLSLLTARSVLVMFLSILRVIIILINGMTLILISLLTLCVLRVVRAVLVVRVVLVRDIMTCSSILRIRPPPGTC